jgi:hypothetical protein
MATEARTSAERAWLFIVLARQLGIDVGLLTYREPVRGPLQKNALREPDTIVWACAALIDGKAHLFDTRIGLPVPGPEGKGVATLDQAIADPAILARLDIAGSPYVTSQPDIANAKFRVLIESTPTGFAQRMNLLQKELAGRDRMVLYRNPVEVDREFRAALGDRCESVDLWNLPVDVFLRLFNDPLFVQATQYHLQMFEKRWPLLYARMQHLLGETTASLQAYVNFRFADDSLQDDGKTPIPSDIQRILDLYSTYYLPMVHLDRNDTKQAEFLFKETLRILPKYGRSNPLFICMFRWGAASNLGRIYAAQGKNHLAIRYLTQENPTTQGHGDRYLARELIWNDPFAPPDDTPPVVPAPDQLPPLRVITPPKTQNDRT